MNDERDTDATTKTLLRDAPLWLSDALAMAIEDAWAIEAAQHRPEPPRVRTEPNHRAWYEPVVDAQGRVRRCEICLAGAVMARMMSAKDAMQSHEPLRLLRAVGPKCSSPSKRRASATGETPAPAWKTSEAKRATAGRAFTN